MAPQSSAPQSKPLSLRALASAISKIENIRQLEHSCEVCGVQITLRPLLPEQEVEVQEYVATAWRDGRDEKASYADFMDRLRYGALSYALIQIDDLDLRDTEYVETDEVDENGHRIALPKVDALRSLFATTWTRPMLTAVFAQYGTLLEKLDARAGSAVTYNPIDLDGEIERLERRLVDLKASKEKQGRPPEDIISRRQKAVLDTQAAVATVARDTAAATPLVDEVPSPPEDPPPAPPRKASPPASPSSAAPAPGTRRSAVPTAASSMAAPARPPEEHQLEIDAQDPSLAQTKGAPEVERDHLGRPMPLGGDSFFDPSNPDAALAIEEQRMMEILRAQAEQRQARASATAQREELGLPSPQEMARDVARGQSRADLPTPAARVDDRTGGLRSAANTSNQVLDAGAGSIRAARPQTRPTPGAPGVPAQLHGVPVYQHSETQVLERPARTTPSAPPPQINSEGGSRNPRFTPPKR